VVVAGVAVAGAHAALGILTVVAEKVVPSP
jgi:hypothetical protein